MMKTHGYLVGGWSYPSEKYESQMGRIIPYMKWNNNPNVPNHQPG
jgi:hypothetical protein